MMFIDKKIKDICLFVGGSQPPKSTFINFSKTGYVRLIQIRDRLNDDFLTYIPLSQAKKFCKPHEILIGRYGPPIFQIFRGFEGAYNVALMKAQPVNGTDNDWLYYFLQQKSILNYVESMSLRTAGQTGVELDSLYEYPVKLPELSYQKRVASFLLQIDSKINSDKAIIREIQEIINVLYNYWFLQFDFPDDFGKPYKTSGGTMVYSSKLARNIPQGWNVDGLIDNALCSDIKAGVQQFVAKNYLPTANVNNEEIVDGNYISFESRESRANMEPKEFSVWFAKMKNSVKHISIPDDSDWFVNKYILSTGFQGLKCSKDSFAYIHSIINSCWFENLKDILSHGATQESINNEDLKNVLIPIPPKELLEKYAEIINPLLRKKFHLIKEIMDLQKYLEDILPLLMTGQVILE